MDEIIKAASSLLADIEAMETERRDWYGGFSGYRVDHEDEVAYVEWPNLGICAESLRRLIEAAQGN